MGSIKSFPNNRDEYVGAEYAMRWLHGRTSGVFAANNNASVAAVQNSMAVTVSDGLGWITDAENNGVVWWNDTEKSTGAKMQLTVDAADGVLNRIDRVIVEWKTTDYADLPEIKILKGTASSTAAAPALTNNTTVRQISLAKISVAAGTTSITASMITDERLDTSVCGLVTESVTADTSVINAQFAELLSRLQTAIDQAISGEIADGSVTTPKYADGSVTAAKLAPEAVTREKMASDAFAPADNAGAHNAVYRGKNLGSAVTAAQWAAIGAGTFDNLFIGDYWTINDVIWRIAAFDYYINTGDVACTTHHAVIVPDSCLIHTAKWNNAGNTTGAYVSSTAYTTHVPAAQTTIAAAFGSDHILSHRQYFANATANGMPSAVSWYDNSVALMTQANVYGNLPFGPASNGANFPYNYSIDCIQYPLFAYAKEFIRVGENHWLRDVLTAKRVAMVDTGGACGGPNSDNAFGIRPAFCIKAA